VPNVCSRKCEKTVRLPLTPRCQKPREVVRTVDITLTLREATSEEAPVAIIENGHTCAHSMTQSIGAGLGGRPRRKRSMAQKTILLAVPYNDPADSFLLAVTQALAAAPVPSSEIDVQVAPSDHHRDPVDPQQVLLVEKRHSDRSKEYCLEIF
jgi:hypothetical protein